MMKDIRYREIIPSVRIIFHVSILFIIRYSFLSGLHKDLIMEFVYIPQVESVRKQGETSRDVRLVHRIAEIAMTPSANLRR